MWFNPQEHDASGAFGSAGMPLGKYPVAIVGSSVAATSTNERSGKLVFDLLILDGPNKDHKGQWTLNLFNENEQARQIAGRQLAAVCAVTNTHQLVAKPEGVELWNKPFMIEFRKQPKDDRYTECCGVWDITGNPPVGGKAAATTQSAPPAQFGQQQPPAQFQPAPQQPASGVAATQGGGGWQPAQPQQQPSQGAGGWSAPTQQPTQQAQQPAQPWSQQPAQGGPAPWGAR